jgi:hypothetical protein
MIDEQDTCRRDLIVALSAGPASTFRLTLSAIGLLGNIGCADLVGYPGGTRVGLMPYSDAGNSGSSSTQGPLELASSSGASTLSRQLSSSETIVGAENKTTYDGIRTEISDADTSQGESALDASVSAGQSTQEYDSSGPLDSGTADTSLRGDLDDLIGAICGWEFRCCDDGERSYRFGPAITDADTCTARFVHELRQSNSTKNPFVAGPAASGLLASLAYAINLRRVEVDADAVAACTAQWQARDCNQPAPETAGYCGSALTDGVDTCSLNTLFKPALKRDDACTPNLGQGATNDIECVPGTSCLAADDPANGNEVPSCVKCSLAMEFCQEDSDCDFGLYCDGDVCVENGDAGDSCTYGSPRNTCKLGLKCDPTNQICTAPCTNGFECEDHDQCPSGSSCAPTFIDDDLFNVCRDLGRAVTDLCRDERDCVQTQHCQRVDGGDPIGSCVPDRELGDDCSGLPGECAAGTFCDSAVGTCQAHNTPDQQCTRANDTGADPKNFPECSPSTAGCFPRYNDDVVAVEYFCRNAKNENGADCWVNADCQSGKCEVDGDADPYLYRTGFICTPGGDVGEECDAYHSCSAGAVCDPAEAVCVVQLAPGANCDNPDTESGDSYLCANGVCVEQWDMVLCSDAPVPESAGGSGVSCDGE